jgi:hypothetical protein
MGSQLAIGEERQTTKEQLLPLLRARSMVKSLEVTQVSHGLVHLESQENYGTGQTLKLSYSL